MKEMEVFGFRGGENILNNLSLEIDNYVKDVNFKQKLKGGYNVRCIFEKSKEELLYSDSILGDLVYHENMKVHKINEVSKVFLKSNDLIIGEIDLRLENSCFVDIKIFVDKPVSNYSVLQALPIPTDILTIYINFLEEKELKKELVVHKHFDAYSHLGFFLVEIDRMKEVLYKEYGSKELDLVHEFSNSHIIEELFKEEIIMIVWGINPYAYPIYSSENPNNIIPLLGREFEEEGVFNIREDIKELSLIPGHELRSYPSFLNKDWKKIKLEGKGKKTYLKPYLLEDSNLETVLTSFLIYREEGTLKESKPLVNVDLLYS
ncbi:hypothetical protein ACCC68_03565 [Tenacibaculum maritimum]|uniref:hypothetical protein n=1 Tax=Tenacibaculum maritimum TaxID=107401 RepID=UPI00352B351A